MNIGDKWLTRKASFIVPTVTLLSLSFSRKILLCTLQGNILLLSVLKPSSLSFFFYILFIYLFIIYLFFFLGGFPIIEKILSPFLFGSEKGV